ncbi:MAG: hypothetical protein ACQXXG_04240 [Candidatus Bathyarchaeia archaeon]
MKQLIFGLAAGTTLVAFSILLQVSEETLQALIIFNVFFACMLFPLNGPLKRKMLALIMGNSVCLIWNNLFSVFVGAITAHALDGFNAVFVVLSPILNLLWVVSFWSLSLTFLANSKNERAAAKNAY